MTNAPNRLTSLLHRLGVAGPARMGAFQGSGAPARTSVLAILTAVLATLACSGAFAAPTLAAEACPNEQVRGEQGSAYLPDCRAYEKVTPIFKGGYGAGGILGVEAGGEAVAYASAGVFAGEQNQEGFDDYEAIRSSAEWSTVPLMPSASFAPNPPGGVNGFSSSFGASLWGLDLGGLNHDSASNELQFAVHAPGAPDTQAGFQNIGPPVRSLFDDNPVSNGAYVEGFSDDLCHVVMGDSAPVVSEAGENIDQIFDLSAGCHGEPSYLRVVSLNSAGGLLSNVCSTSLGDGGDRFNAISGDGSEIFFHDGVISSCIDDEQLFVRVGGVRTLEVSKPLGECVGGEVPCAGAAVRASARFWGASEDGSRVFFTTTAPLTGGTDMSSNLYMAKIGCPGEVSGCEAGQRVVTGLVQVSDDPHAGQAAEAQGVVGIAPDGARVYFVARGVLSEAANQQGVVAVDGADNLYVYDSLTGQTVFVGDLCSGPEASGVVGDVACPDDLETTQTHGSRNDTPLWSEFPESSAQTTGGDGGFLVFSTYARLITSGPEADADDAQDVYRYDAQTGGLLRVSVGEAGYDANGNRNDGGAVVGEIAGRPVGAGDALIQPTVVSKAGAIDQQERGGFNRAISEDGSRIVFMTAEPLSARAINHQVNVYEWHEGSVSLISCGCSTEADSEPVISPSGRDVFFATSAGLVRSDTDGAPDIYDARSGGGFPVSEAPVERCEGDACQGPLTNPAPLLVPGSAVQAPGENAPAAAAPVVGAKGKSKAKKQVKKKRKAKKESSGKSRVKKSAKGRK